MTTSPTGTRAVIVGNGPSVDAVPPAFWKGAVEDPDCLLIGTNRVLCLEAVQGVPFDVLVIRDTYRNLWHKQEVGIRYHEELWKPSKAYKVGPGTNRAAQCNEFCPFRGGWHYEREPDSNRECPVMVQRTVVLMAANWAWWAGVRTFFLLGVDYRPGPDGRGHAKMLREYHSHSPGWEGQYDKPIGEALLRDFRDARTAIESAGGRIVNLSPDTRLDVIPKSTWETEYPWRHQ